VAALIYKSFPVAGIEPDGDDLKVVGKCSDGAVDHDGDIVSPSWMASAVKSWMATYPAVRFQHRADYPVGRGLEAWTDDQGATWVKALIVDDKAQKMVRRQVLRAFSVGIAEPQTRPSQKARRWEIYGGRLAEVSLVDSPSNARCGIEVCKSAGGRLEYSGKPWKKPKSAVKAARVRERELAAVLAIEHPVRREAAYAELMKRRD
jgi:hypothetical protein